MQQEELLFFLSQKKQLAKQSIFTKTLTILYKPWFVGILT